MATLYVSEYAQVPYGAGQPIMTGVEPATAEQTVSISGTSAASSAFSPRTTFVRVHTDAICSILFGSSPTAVTTAKRMAANQTEFFGVIPGHKVAVISNT